MPLRGNHCCSGDRRTNEHTDRWTTSLHKASASRLGSKHCCTVQCAGISTLDHLRRQFVTNSLHGRVCQLDILSTWAWSHRSCGGARNSPRIFILLVTDLPGVVDSRADSVGDSIQCSSGCRSRRRRRCFSRGRRSRMFPSKKCAPHQPGKQAPQRRTLPSLVTIRRHRPGYREKVCQCWTCNAVVVVNKSVEESAA